MAERPLMRPSAGWRNGRLRAYLALQIAIVAMCVCLFYVQPPDPPPLYELVRAEESRDGLSWQPVALPHRRAYEGRQPEPVLYRMNFERPSSEAGASWAVLVPHFTAGVEISVNGTLVLDSRRETYAARMDRNVPAMALIPQPLLRDGVNDLVVRLLIWGPFAGYLDNVYVGPDALLRPVYDTRSALFFAVPLVLAALQGMLAILFGMIWINRRGEPAYGWLAGAMVIGAGQQFIPLPAPQALVGFLGAANSLEVAMLLHFLACYLRLKILPAGWLAFVPGFAILGAGLFGSADDLLRMHSIFGPTSVGVLLVVIAVMLGRSAVRQKDRRSLFLGSTMTVVIAFWVHDIAAMLNVLPGERLFLARISYSLVLTAIGIGLTWRFIEALKESDNFAGRLVQQVREAEEKLRESFAREEERGRNEALAAERTRLMRDLHDGLGGQLVSIVALAERIGREGAAIGEAARAALKDLRLVIDAMEEIDGDLMLALGSWRERIATQLRAHEIGLSWQVPTPGGLPVFPGLRPWHVIQIVRLLDEAVTNAIKHSGAGMLRVVIEAVPDGAGNRGGRIVIEDDGKGFDIAALQPGGAVRGGFAAGHGLANMRRRAELCGADLALSSGPAGTRVSLSLPAGLGVSAAE